MIATGRRADTDGLDLANAGVVTCDNGKFNVDGEERTNVSHIYAVGDVLEVRFQRCCMLCYTARTSPYLFQYEPGRL